MTAMRKGKYTAKQFNSSLPDMRRCNIETIEIAKQHLVNGVTQKDLAEIYNKKQQAIHVICKRIEAIIEKTPDGWVKVSCYLPKHLAEKVKAMEAEERMKLERCGQDENSHPKQLEEN